MFELFDHTADLGLRVVAPDLNTLFAEAGQALFAAMVQQPEQVRPEVSTSVQLQADCLDDLLYDWLAELLYLFDTRRLLPCRFEVAVSGTCLRAELRGEPFDPDRHELATEVKAVTYHGLKVVKQADGWLAEVIVDL